MRQTLFIDPQANHPIIILKAWDFIELWSLGLAFLDLMTKKTKETNDILSLHYGETNIEWIVSEERK